LEKFKKQGLGVAAISYDSPEILKQIADRLGITYPLLSDAESKIIRSFGILNKNIPEDHLFHGIPFPGTYIVDSRGTVVSKYFEQWHRQRFTADTILIKEFSIGGDNKTEVRTDHMKICAFTSQHTVRPGNRISIVLEIELPEKMHIYAEGAEGYTPISLQILEDPNLRIHDPEYPEAEILYIEVIKESVPIYKHNLRIMRDVTLSPGYRGSELVISGTLGYQACDDKYCYLPVEVPLKLELQVRAHDFQRAPEAMRH
jgi:hypothetical protein